MASVIKRIHSDLDKSIEELRNRLNKDGGQHFTAVDISRIFAGTGGKKENQPIIIIIDQRRNRAGKITDLFRL